MNSVGDSNGSVWSESDLFERFKLNILANVR